MIPKPLAQEIIFLANVYAHATSAYVLAAIFSPENTETKEVDLIDARKALLKAIDEITVKEMQ